MDIVGESPNPVGVRDLDDAVRDGQFSRLHSALDAPGLVHEAVDRGRGVDEIVAGMTQGGPQVHGVVGEDPPGLGLRLGGLALEAVGAETGQLLVHVLVLVRDRLERVPGVVQGRAAPGQDIIESRHRISETLRHGQG